VQLKQWNTWNHKSQCDGRLLLSNIRNVCKIWIICYTVVFGLELHLLCLFC
jgi:hypothetical protein